MEIKKRRCSLCDGEDTELMFQIEPFNIVRCQRCGLYYTDSIIEMGEAKEIYSETYYTELCTSGSLYSKLRSLIARYIKRGLFEFLLNRIMVYKSEGRILDVGCATGEFLRIAREHGWETSGVEFSQFTSNIARERSSLNVFTGGVKEASYKDKFFDVVTLWAVFSHLPDPVGDFLEINRILDNDGILAFMTGNHDLIPANRIKSLWGNPKEHNCVLNGSSLKVLLEKTGFELIKGVQIGIMSPKRLRDFHISDKLTALYSRFPILSLLYNRPLISHSMLFICRKADLVTQR